VINLPGRDKKCIQNFVMKTKRKRLSEELVVDDRVIEKYFVRMMMEKM